ncbi:hypothetical protein [Phenylobacterium soli]|uniref:Uncharacterized protein n=1 Tax=Phenylobacterium soli TaxID=2170551 RepID=A0A328AJF1_9CAUL|nr:hypothetical protein [Phenylobacterium soli]RAK54637.1 hypothetical protein DJ017_08930 [Phenylobacterium soli]
MQGRTVPARAIAVAAALGLAAAPALAAEPAPAAPKTMGFTPKTYVDGPVLQVILGERALFRLDDSGNPVLESVEKGQLAVAHPAGAVSETFKPPAFGAMGVALDGSAEKKASSIKVWNGTGRPVQYRAVVLVLHGETLRPVAVPTCPVAPGATRIESWPAPIVAVGLSRFKAATKAALAQPACKKGK